MNEWFRQWETEADEEPVNLPRFIGAALTLGLMVGALIAWLVTLSVAQ